MLLLAVDTSGPQGGITLAQVFGDRVEPIESISIQGGTFSAELIPQISDLLSRHQLTAQLLQGLVAVTGPGSFTGLRVGLTAVKALAEVLRIPIAGATSLELLIAASGVETRAMAVLDAGQDDRHRRGVADNRQALAEYRSLDVEPTSAEQEKRLELRLGIIWYMLHQRVSCHSLSGVF